MQGEGKKLTQIVAALSATFGALSLGLALSWSSPALPHIVDCDPSAHEDGYCDFNLGTEAGSWIGALLTIGALVSSFVTGFLMSKIGRKWTMIGMAIPSVIGWVLLTMTQPLEWGYAWIFYVGRILTGFGGGAFSLASPIYISEIAESSVRGALGSLMQLQVTFGVFWNNGLGALIAWPILTGICIIFPLIMAVLMFFMPESPYFLLLKGKDAEAAKALQWLRGKDHDIGTELEEIKDSQRQQESIGSVSPLEILTKGVYLKPTLVMLGLMLFQQFSGINAVLFNLTDIFIKANSGIEAELGATIVALVQFLATGIAVLIVERFGRKTLLIISDALMCISIIALGVFFYFDENKNCAYDDPPSEDVTSQPQNCDPDGKFDPDMVSSLGWLPLVSLIVYVFAFSIGYGPIPWMMNGEIFALEAKGFGSSLATAFNWLCAFLVSKFTVNIQEGIEASGSYFMYGAICAVGTVFVIFLVPETKGKGADEMKEYYMGKKKPRKSIDSS